MKRNFKYLLSLTTGIVAISGSLAGGWWVAANLVFSFGLLSIIDGTNWENKDNATDKDDLLPDMILFFQCLLQTACIVAMIYCVSHYELNILQIILVAVSTGINTGSGAIVQAHELIHRNNKWYQFAGKYLMLTACNIYFYVDHLKVHHKWVGTKKDAATSLYGESLYYFFVRTTLQQIRNAWQHEVARLEKESAFRFGLRNYVTGSVVLIIIISTALFLIFGFWILFAFLLQALTGNFLLEYTNYIEHYGLLRSEDERVTELHSWQSDKVISRFFLIDLSRHADHHYYASKPYSKLLSYENAPVLPGGYARMIWYALIPPLWFKTIHPILEAKGYIQIESGKK